MLAIALSAALSLSAADTVPSVDAVRVPRGTAPPAVDGRLDDAAWALARPVSNFVQTAPTPGAASTQPTEARVLYTDDALYVALRMADSAPDSIAAQLARRDAIGIYSDWAHVVVDSYGDNRTAFRFSVNPRGVKKDVFHFNDAGEDRGWDAVWDVATTIDSAGWTAEYRIPLSQLRFNARSGGELAWGINFGREIARNEERAYWAPITPGARRYVSFSGDLRGVSGLGSPRRLEIQPYSLARVTRAPDEAGNPFYDESALDATVGADLRYGLTSDLTLSATINPDFGQVEADPAEVNLSAFENRFEERRPFFSEGTDIFEFGIGQVSTAGGEELFYSRRVGRAPQRSVRAEYVDAPTSTNILAAAKLSGKTGGWSIGLLNAVTGRESARAFAAGNDTVYQVEPLTNYSVGRVSRDFRQGGSAVGAVVTAALRDVSAENGLDFLHDRAVAAGVDARHRFGGGHYEVSGWVLGSSVRGSERALLRTQRSSARYLQRPDRDTGCRLCLALDPERTSLAGTAAHLEVNKLSGGHLRGTLTTTVRSAGFEVNDLGFMQQADAASGFYQLDYVEYRPGRTFRNWRAGVNGGYGWTLGGEQTLAAGVAQGSFQLRNFWSGDAGVVRFWPTLSTTQLRGGPALRGQGRTGVFGGFNSDARRRVRVGASFTYELEDGTDASLLALSPEVAWRPSARTELSVGPSVTVNRSSWQYLATRPAADDQPVRYLGGELDQTTMALTTRLSYAFTPGLSLQLYGEPFVSAGDFTRILRVVDPHARRHEDRFTEAGESDVGGSPDFNVKSFRGNAVLRWEYRPGSTLFVVWSQTRDGRLADGSFGVGRDFGRLFGFADEGNVPSTNVLLIKLSYWLNR